MSLGMREIRTEGYRWFCTSMGCVHLILRGEMKDFAVCQTLPNPQQLSPDGLGAENGVTQMVPRGMLFLPSW